MTSRSATVLVIFIVAVFAFCLASVFASMTGQISIVPNETQSGGILDNLSAITDEDSNANSYGYQEYNDYSSDDSSSNDDSKVETTTDTSTDTKDTSQKNPEPTQSDKQPTESKVETTVDDSSNSKSKEPVVETTTG